MVRLQLSKISLALHSLCSQNIVLLFIAVTCCSVDFARALCQWHIDVTSRDKPFVKTAFIRDRESFVPLQDFSRILYVNNMEKKEYGSFPYFLYLQVYCEGKPSLSVGRTLASSGTVPIVTLTHIEQHLENHRSNVLEYTMPGVLVSLNDSEAELNQPAWLVPLVFDLHTRVIPVYVETGNSGYEVRPVRQVVNIDGYHELLSDDSYNYTSILGPMVPITQQMSQALLTGRPYKVTYVHGKTPTYVMGGIPNSSVVILSSDEFRTLNPVEIILPTQNETPCLGTPTDPLYIKQALSLPDRLLFNTPSGLYEAFGQYAVLDETQDPTGIVKSDPTRCYGQMVVPAQSKAAKVHVLAIEESGNRHRIFAAHARSGVPLNFKELLDVHDRGVCEILTQTDGGCNVISAAASGTQDGTFLLLVEGAASYYLAVFSGNTLPGEWNIVSNFSISQCSPSGDYGRSSDITDSEPLSPESETWDAVPLLLRGMTFSGVISSHLLLWGRRLLHSPDGGASLYILSQYTSDANITLLTVSQDTGFAFLNQLDEVWYGLLGETIVLHQLRPSSGFTLFVSLLGLVESLGDEEETLTLFFDLNNQLQELVASVNSSTGKTAIHRRAFPVADIVEHQTYIRSRNDYSQVDEQGAGYSPSVPPACPYDFLHFEFSQLHLYVRQEKFEFGAPYISYADRLHTVDSLMAYQAIVHSMKTQDEDVALEVHEFDTFDPFYHWRQSTLPLMAYNDYVFRNKLLGSHIAISPLDYIKLYDADDIVSTATVPDEIFLDRGESFHFAIFLMIDQDQRNETRSLDELRISVEVSDQELVEVSTLREVVHLNSSVKYQVHLTDKGSLGTQSSSGMGLHPVSVLVQIWNSPFRCFTHDSVAGNQLQGTSTMSIQLGCPPGRHLIFDIAATMQRARELYDRIYDCPIPDPELPCFYYKQDFNPVFRVLDLVTGKSSLFTGQYTLSVIGGSIEGPDKIEYFDSGEVQQYNQQNGSGPLIWKAKDASSSENGSVHTFRHDHGGIQWRCEPGSPCASIPMNFPWPPEYYFAIEVTNRGVDDGSTYCEYTARLTVKVHGLELSKFDLLAIVGWSLGLSVVFIFMFVICHHHKTGVVKRRRPHKRKSRVAPMPTIEEVEVSEESETEEVINIVEGHKLGEVSASDLRNKSTFLMVPGITSPQHSALRAPSDNPLHPRQKTSERL